LVGHVALKGGMIDNLKKIWKKAIAASFEVLVA
jgi:hypothetical protein